MPTQKKMDLVEELKDKMTRCSIAVATDYTRLAVNAMTQLRAAMRAKEIEYKVVKNTLTYLAADSAGTPEFKEIVKGPTALAFGYQDPAEVARALEEYIRVNRSSLKIRGATLQGRTLTPGQVATLSSLPPRAELVARLLGRMQQPVAALAGQLQAPLSRLLTVLNGPQTSLAMLLQRRLEQLGSQQEAS